MLALTQKCTLASRFKPSYEAKLAREYFFSPPKKNSDPSKNKTCIVLK